MSKPVKTARKHTQETPSSPARDHYEAMRIATKAATEKIVRLIEDLGRFAMPLLADWSKCYIEVSGLHTPTQMAEHRKAVHGDMVPTVHDLREALIHQFETQLGATQAWNVLSPEERKGLQPPPGVAGRTISEGA